VLSTIPAIANVTFGYAAGIWIQQKGRSWEGLSKLLLTGAVLIVLAMTWDWVFPINKKLWTGSYVLLTVGIDCILLGALFYKTDFVQIRSTDYFFEVFGKNPLFIYLLSELGVSLLWFFEAGDRPLYSWLYNTVFVHAGAYWGSFLFALSVMLLCWLLGYMLDKKKIYIRV
jgi:predicted acyltransferase